MRSAMRTAHAVRLAAILAVGAFALHQLAYLIAFGGASLAEQDHGYMMDLLAPLAVLVLAAAVATLIRGIEDASAAGAPLGRRIAIFAVALFAIYIGQESLEAILSVGQAGAAGSAVVGSWIAAPLALGLGALAAVLAGALEAVERTLAAVCGQHRVPMRAPAVSGRSLGARARRLPSVPLAFGLARRPPPPVPA